MKFLKKLEWERVLDYLNRFALSDFVKEKIENLIPSFNLEDCIGLQNKTRFILDLINKEKIELTPLKSLNKLKEKAIKRGFFLPSELCEIKKWFLTLRPILNHLKNSPFEGILGLYEELIYLERRMDAILDYERGKIKDKASYTLFIIRRKIRENTELLYSKIEKLKDHFYKKGYLQENLYTQKEGRYVLPVKIEYKNKVRGILHGLSSSGATVFIEPISIVTLTNEIEELRFQEQREEARILKEISEEIFQKRDHLKELEELYSEFEIAFAKVKLGKTYKGVLPELKKEGPLKIVRGVHPFLILSSLEEESRLTQIVYNDFILERGLLITGPNLGGKTVSLKTIGILVLMAQSGFLVSAEKAEIPVFKEIFVDIGDDQDLFLRESSFSSHLKILKEIIDKAEQGSLVLLDEPGRGTDPEQGLSLIASIVEEMLKRKVVLVITTHSHFLKALIQRFKDFKIASMGYDLEKREPTYRLIYDEWGDSLAFELARKIGIPQHIISRAEEYLKNREYWEWHKLWLKKLEEIKAREIELLKKEKVLEENERTLEEEKRKLKKKYVITLEERVKDWEEAFKKFLFKLETDFSNRRKALERFEEFVESFLKDTSLEEPLKEGDTVLIKSLNKEGRVLRVKQNTVEVFCGKLRLEVPIEKVIKIEKKFEVKGQDKLRFKERRLNYERVYLNIIGKNVEEALEEIERVLNRAFLGGYRELHIIHGHGTGKLREAVQEFLKDHPLVKQFKFADFLQGGTGTTIVYLEEKD